MIWELHKDGSHYLYEGHELLGGVDPNTENVFFTAWVRCKYLPWDEFKTLLEAKAWVEKVVKEKKSVKTT